MGTYTAIYNFMHEWNLLTILLRLLLAMVCGGSVGLMRSLRRRNAGFKTHAVVCVGATLVMLTSVYIYMEFGPSFEIARLPAQVVSGVGFLGVGTIIVTGKNHIQGLTTAAGLWTCAGIGLALGIGFYSGALITTLLLLIVYRFLENMDEYAFSHSSILYLYVVIYSKDQIGTVLQRVKENYRVVKVEVGKANKKADSAATMTMIVDVGHKKSHQKIINEMLAYEGVLIVEEL
ncbi:MAG: MgtC/SapB family protein [Dorea sp.]|nr:MgtC/SapB family protein [Dorea sp.]